MSHPLGRFTRSSAADHGVLRLAADLGIWAIAAVVGSALLLPARWPPVGVVAAYLALGLVVKTLVLRAGSLERRPWHRTTAADLLRMAEVVALGSLVLFGVGLAIHDRFPGFPSTMPLVEGIVAVLLMGSVRLAVSDTSERAMRRDRTGVVDIPRLRDIQVEELLGRSPVPLDLGSIGYIEGTTVLVTGAGGSIGAEITRQLARLGARTIVLLDHDENALHALGYVLDRDHPGVPYDLVVGSVRDPEKLRRLIGEYSPEVVFHAAAHKHVPLLERAADEAILNNVGGTLHVAQAAAEGGVRWFVHTSSDKAVGPVSMLGATKLVAEQVVRAVAASVPEGSAYVSVRLGNVLGSQGSVVRVFADQIRRGGPVTVTHPDMTRYVMTIPEASRLAIQAGALDTNGATYFLEMGSPVVIGELAEDMIRLSGADPDEIRIEYTGLRPGERLTEELHSADEEISPTRYEGITAVDTDRDPRADLLDLVRALLSASEAREWGDVGACLDKLCPGFVLPMETTDRI